MLPKKIEAALNAQDMKDVTGIHDASLGAQSNETSGRAIMARDRQGDVATFIYPDNLKDAIREGGEGVVVEAEEGVQAVLLDAPCLVGVAP